MWRAVQLASIAMLVGLCFLLGSRPEAGLKLFWQVIIPFLPLLLFTAPGVWRNICPIATINQLPSHLGISMLRKVPGTLRRHSLWISAGLLSLIIPLRKLVLNSDAAALAICFVGVLAVAFVMGCLFKGKSGWCTSFCPVLPVERLYGQTPFVRALNAHCEPCRVCTTNCYDRNPPIAFLEEQFRGNRNSDSALSAFAALFPGLIAGYYTISEPVELAVLEVYGYFGICMAVSAVLCWLLSALTRWNAGYRTMLFTILAFNLYYWFNAPLIAELIASPWPTSVLWTLRSLVFCLSVMWGVRTFRLQRQYHQLIASSTAISSPFSSMMSADLELNEKIGSKNQD